jgi:SAM-dependent methyltransferase
MPQLVAPDHARHKQDMAPEIFSRAARRAIAARAANSKPADRWLLAYLHDEALQRLAANDAHIGSVLVTGPVAFDVAASLHRQGAQTIVIQSSDSVEFDEDRPPFADGSFDAILAVGGLDTVNDLPGALLRFRQMLKPGGLFIGSMAAAGSLPALRAAMSGLAPGPYFHPQIDVRAAGDLLTRAGFALPISDLDFVRARYSELGGLLRDLRANGFSSALPEKAVLTRRQRTTIADAFKAAAVDGKTPETFSFVHLNARATFRPL